MVELGRQRQANGHAHQGWTLTHPSQAGDVVCSHPPMALLPRATHAITISDWIRQRLDLSPASTISPIRVCLVSESYRNTRPKNNCRFRRYSAWTRITTISFLNLETNFFPSRSKKNYARNFVSSREDQEIWCIIVEIFSFYFFLLLSNPPARNLNPLRSNSRDGNSVKSCI